MFRYVGLGAIFLSISLSAFADQNFDREAIAEVRVEEVLDNNAPQLLAEPECVAGEVASLPIMPLVDWSDIVNYGQQIWKVVVDNKPVVHVQTPVAHAMPRGLKCWSELDGWKAPITKTYKVSYINGFKKEVVHFRFRIHYTYNGGRSGIGRYLANVTVMPATLDVSWGYTFEAGVEVGQPVNLGTADNPQAGLEVNLGWTVKTVLKESRSTVHFFVQGDGNLITAQ